MNILSWKKILSMLIAEVMKEKVVKVEVLSISIKFKEFMQAGYKDQGVLP